jgi:hypothetical protein
MKKSYSQAGQDRFVLSLFDKNYRGVFVDIGCNKPDFINNTLLLEENGWTGISLDIADYKNEWKIRKTLFLMQDALKCDYKQVFTKHCIINPVDYLSLDIEIEGSRYLALKKVMESGYEFKIITIEHDGFRGYDLTERQPQRKLLNDMGYFLLCSDVMLTNNPMEDWWINPKYFNESQYIFYRCSNTCYSEILNKNEKNNYE